MRKLILILRSVSSPDIGGEDTGHLCESVLQDFSSVLSVDPSSSGTHKPVLQNGDTPLENGYQDSDATHNTDGVISSSLMVKLVVMAIATVTRLQSKGKCHESFPVFLGKDSSITKSTFQNSNFHAVSHWVDQTGSDWTKRLVIVQ